MLMDAGQAAELGNNLSRLSRSVGFDAGLTFSARDREELAAKVNVGN